MTRAEIREALAVAIGDRWFEICEEPTRWAALDEMKRTTFRVMVDHALTAGRRGEKTPGEVAEALCAGFFADAGTRGLKPWPWASLNWQKREVFFRCAAALLARAGELQNVRKAA